MIVSGLVPVAFAVLLSEVKSRRFRSLVQTATTLPNFISWVLVFAFMYNMFSSDGLFMRIATMINPMTNFRSPLIDVKAAWYVQAGIYLWKTCGWNAIIYLAAITGIDQELYEAAVVDGANRWQKIWHITVPGLIETYFVLLLLSLGWMLSVGFEQFFVFYNAQVADRITVIDLFVYQVGIQSQNISYAIAIGMFKTIVSIILLTASNLLAKRVRGATLI